MRVGEIVAVGDEEGISVGIGVAWDWPISAFSVRKWSLPWVDIGNGVPDWSVGTRTEPVCVGGGVKEPETGPVGIMAGVDVGGGGG